MLKSSVLFAMALIFFSAIAVSGFAQGVQGPTVAVGWAEYRLLTLIVTGNFGMFVGVLVTFMGVWLFFVKGDSGFGLFLIIMGALITFTPKLYTGVRNITCPIANSLGAKCGGFTFDKGTADPGGAQPAQQK